MDSRFRINPIWLITALAALLILGLLSFQGYFSSREIPESASSEFQLMAEAWNTIQDHYVDRADVPPRSMTYAAIRGMVQALGDTGHTTFLTPQMVRQEKDFTSGRYKGIGVEIRIDNGHVVVLAPFDGSPAQKAGIRQGDIILQVDGKGTSGVPINQVAEWVLGPEGTSVTLTILDPVTRESRTVVLKRADIVTVNVSWRRLPGGELAHLRIAGFSKGVTADLQSALKSIQQARQKGVILDLRNNPGGLLDEAVGCASQFLTGGNVLLEKDQQGKTTAVPVRRGGVATRIRMVVLINKGSASGAEVMAGALQDHKRAPLVGETTFGTGTVLSQFPLSDGSAILLAVREWLTPGGHLIWHKGIVPDYAVPLPKGVGPLLPEMEGNLSPAQLRNTRDDQLLRAVRLLNPEAGKRP